jgi:hypothetical protein
VGSATRSTIDLEHDVAAAVARWIDNAVMDGFAGHVVAAVEQ